MREHSRPWKRRIARQEEGGMYQTQQRCLESMVQVMCDPILTFEAKGCPVAIYPDKQSLGLAAADAAGKTICRAIAERGACRLIVSAESSQNELIDELAKNQEIDWRKVEVFQCGEYLGMSQAHLASCSCWLETSLTDRVRPLATHTLRGDVRDMAAECERYTRLLKAGPIDLCLMSMGDNGSVSFNNSLDNRCEDDVLVNHVWLDESMRRQRVADGCFYSLNDVPREALSVVCAALAEAREIIFCVPDYRRANGVKDVLQESLRCPASFLLNGPNTQVFLDARSAALLDVWAEDIGL